MFGTTGSVIMKAIVDNVAKGSKKPLCYGVAYDVDGKPFVLDSLTFWTKTGAAFCCRELKKASGKRFYPVACVLRKKPKVTG